MQTFKTAIMPTVKNIFFAIYEPALNRAVMTVYIVRIILRVLKIGQQDYRSKGLKVKHRAAEILTTLEDVVARQDNNDSGYGGLHYDIHHEILDPANLNNDDKRAQVDKPRSSRKLIKTNKAAQQPTSKRSVTNVFSRNNQSQKLLQSPLSTNSNNKSPQKTTTITLTEKRASIAASLLVELIGVDCEPIKPYFPVLVLYATLYLDKSSNHSSMHNLLVRLIATLSSSSTIEEIEKNSHSFVDDKPSLAAVLTSRTLELLWDDDDVSTIKKEFVTNRGEYVAMDGATFVQEYCSQFEAVHKPNSRIGYEALRWGVSSTHVETTTRSFHIYRQLLTPLDHCTVKVILLALCGAIDNWEASNKQHNPSIASQPEATHRNSQFVDVRSAASNEY
eukprot:304468_1